MANKLLKQAARRVVSMKPALSGLTRPGVDKEIARAIPRAKEGEPEIQFQAYHTQIYTYLTEVGGTRLLYSAEGFITLRLTLENAGPVSVGTSRDLAPVLSGKGILLETDVEYQTTLAKGDRFYITAETVNRVKVTIEPIPFLQQIVVSIAENTRAIVGTLLGRTPAPRAAGAPATAAPSKRAPTSMGNTGDIYCPPEPRLRLPTRRPKR